MPSHPGMLLARPMPPPASLVRRAACGNESVPANAIWSAICIRIPACGATRLHALESVGCCGGAACAAHHQPIVLDRVYRRLVCLPVMARRSVWVMQRAPSESPAVVLVKHRLCHKRWHRRPSFAWVALVWGLLKVRTLSPCAPGRNPFRVLFNRTRARAPPSFNFQLILHFIRVSTYISYVHRRQSPLANHSAIPTERRSSSVDAS